MSTGKENTTDVIQLVTYQGSKYRKYYSHNEHTIKVTSANRKIIDQIIAFLQIGFNVNITSTKMYNEKDDQFYQYLTVEPKGA